MRSIDLALGVVIISTGCGRGVSPTTVPAAAPSADSTARLRAPAPSAGRGEPLSAAERPYVGQYEHESRDSVTQVFLLDDHTFCVAVMPGSPDLLAAGYWKAAARSGGISLREVPAPRSFWATARRSVTLGTRVVFQFEAESLKKAHSPVFVYSSDREPPTELSPVLAQSFEPVGGPYGLPAVASEEARYAFVGEIDGAGGTRPRLRVTRFEVGGAGVVQFSFRPAPDRPRVNLDATLQGETLVVGGALFGQRSIRDRFSKRELPSVAVAQMRGMCIDRVLHAEQPQAKWARAAETELWLLEPQGTFDLEPDAARGTPWFHPLPKTAPPGPQPARQGCPDGMAAVPGGSYRTERQNRVRLAQFCLDVSEVTAEAYAGCVREGQCNDEALICDDAATYRAAGKGDHPINCVDWNQAAAYCRARGKRLPTEEEWVWAARGTTRGWDNPWGNADRSAQVCSSDLTPRPGTCPVGSLPASDGPGGIHDLVGNVAEWTALQQDGGVVIRGQDWQGSGSTLRIGHLIVSARLSTLGFRCAR